MMNFCVDHKLIIVVNISITEVRDIDLQTKMLFILPLAFYLKCSILMFGKIR